MNTDYDFSKFIKAHNNSYYKALSEIKNGKKESHWMWYIFPQIRGLGFSDLAYYYGIEDLREASAYMNDIVLSAHMNEICNALLDLATNDALIVFGYPDNMKLKSSMTLFEKAIPDNEIFSKVLKKFFNGERDQNTLNLL